MVPCHALWILVASLPRLQVVDYSVVRIAQGVTHFSPGSYDSMPTCATPIPNMFMSGDWIVNDHGSFSQGKGSSLMMAMMMLLLSFAAPYPLIATMWYK